eukprot:1157119-Pelagomonas_calceolata.AAC.4
MSVVYARMSRSPSLATSAKPSISSPPASTAGPRTAKRELPHDVIFIVVSSLSLPSAKKGKERVT